MNDGLPPFGSLRERVALWIAPWLDTPEKDAREEAFRRLAEIAYGSRDAVWTSPNVLVSVALRKTAWLAARPPDEPAT